MVFAAPNPGIDGAPNPGIDGAPNPGIDGAPNPGIDGAPNPVDEPLNVVDAVVVGAVGAGIAPNVFAVEAWAPNWPVGAPN